MKKLNLIVCLLMLSLVLSSFSPALAESFTMTAGHSREVKLDPNKTYTFKATPADKGKLNKGHVVIFGQNMTIVSDDLVLGELYQDFGGQRIKVVDMPAWQANSVRGATMFEAQVYEGRIYFEIR